MLHQLAGATIQVEDLLPPLEDGNNDFNFSSSQKVNF